MRRIAFVGNPNVGKSAWINALSDAKFKVGNWAGVTIEKKYADVEWEGEQLQLIDLPGTYSLSNLTNEEGITARYLKEEQVDMIINIVDATNLSRNLYLTLCLRRLQIPMLLILNFMDEVVKYEIDIQVNEISNMLNIPIYAYSAFDHKGVKQIKQAILHPPLSSVYYPPLIAQKEMDVFDQFYHTLRKQLPLFISLDDHEMDWLIYDAYVGKDTTIKQLQSWNIELTHQDDEEDVQIFRCIQDCMKYVHEGKDRLAFTKKLDRYLLHPIYGKLTLLLLFIFMMLFVFQGSAPFNEFIDFLINDMVMKYANALFSFLPDGAKQLLLNGILAGVGGVLVFIPLMAFLNFFLSLLEESGYMARIAFLLDHFMQHFHLNGKSFVSLLLGFGCNVPAIYATRTLDNEKQKRLTALLVPFMSCGARLPVYMLFAAAFFKTKAAIMVLSMYGIGILIALILALIFSHTTTFKDHSLLLVELPPYRKPTMHVVFHKVKQEVQGYIRKATSVVLWAMVILWSLSYFPNGTIESSYIAQFGKTVAPIYEPLGFGTRWESVAALPGSVIAKETVVGFLGQVLLQEETMALPAIDPITDMKSIAYEAGGTLKAFALSFIPLSTLPESDDSLVATLSTFWKDDLANLRAYSYMVYILLSIPCVMTLYALYKEYGFKFMLLSIEMMLVIPYLISLFIFQFFSLVL